MANRVSGLVTRNCRIGGRGPSLIAVGCVYSGMLRRTVVGIDDVTGATSAGSIIAGLIVGAWKREQRIQQAGFLQAENDWVSAQFCAETARAQLDLGFSRILYQAGISNFRFCFASALKHAQH